MPGAATAPPVIVQVMLFTKYLLNKYLLSIIQCLFSHLPAWKLPPHSPGLGSCPGGGSDMSRTWSIFQFFSRCFFLVMEVFLRRSEKVTTGYNHHHNSPVDLFSLQREALSLSRTHHSSSLHMNQLLNICSKGSTMLIHFINADITLYR